MSQSFGQQTIVSKYVANSIWLQDQNEKKFLKIQGSAGWLSRLVCNCSSRSTGIANGTKLAELKKKRNEKLAPCDGQASTEKKIKGEQVVTIKVGKL